jgi:DNA-binding LacI/PurR family transcriptional regulator
MNSRRATLRDVAERAGVAVSTASGVFSRKTFVAPATRALVLAAAEDLGYRPKHFALTPAPGTREVTTLGVLTRWSHQNAVANPFFGPVLQGVEQTCAKIGITVAFEVVGDRAPELPMLVKRGVVQGLIAVSAHEPDYLRDLVATGVGCVLVDHFVEEPFLDTVRDDDQRSGHAATRHLLESGHTRPPPAMIAGPTAMTSIAERVAGYRRALAEAMVPFDPTYLVRDVELNPSGGREAMARLLELPVPPTAVFCSSDTVAIGALAMLDDRGIGVPEQVSLIGHDDIDLAAHTTPPLSTMHVDKRLLGAQAVWHLVQRLENPDLAVRDTRLRVSLVRRNSVGPPPGHAATAA